MTKGRQMALKATADPPKTHKQIIIAHARTDLRRAGVTKGRQMALRATADPPKMAATMRPFLQTKFVPIVKIV